MSDYEKYREDMVCLFRQAEAGLTLCELLAEPEPPAEALAELPAGTGGPLDGAQAVWDFLRALVFEPEEEPTAGPAPEDLEKARELARQFGSDEAEEQRLMDLGRRVEGLLAREEPPEGLREALDAGAEYLSAGQLFAGANAAWDWIREQFLGPAPGSLATGGATGMEDIQEAVRRQGEAEEDSDGH